MFWKRESRFLRTTTFRLTILHLGVFSSLSVVVFLIVYVSLAFRLQDQTDRDLLDEAREFAALYQKHGVRELQNEFINESAALGTGSVFFQLLSSDGEFLASSDLSRWKAVDESRPNGAVLQGNLPGYRTLRLPGQRYKVRVITLQIPDGKMIEVGSSLQREGVILKRYRETFGASLAAMVGFGGIFGFLLARKAMSGVQRVTDTATGIGRRDLGRRVSVVEGEGEEIKALAQSFNAMLERIEALLGEFREITDNVAHELRTPITRIRGLAETTLNSFNDIEEYREMAALIIEGCDDLIEMISTMLEIAKADSGTASLDLASLNLPEIIEDAVDLFAPMAEDRGIEIRLVRSTWPAIVNGDRRKIQRIFSNLLDNAIKYTPHGGTITITVDVKREDVSVSVSDTGIGISEKQIPHIFDRFYRCDKSRSTPGSGLGLSLALAIVHSHGGDITVTSSGNGSTFVFTLPLSSSPSV